MFYYFLIAAVTVVAVVSKKRKNEVKLSSATTTGRPPPPPGPELPRADPIEPPNFEEAGVEVFPVSIAGYTEDSLPGDYSRRGFFPEAVIGNFSLEGPDVTVTVEILSTFRFFDFEGRSSCLRVVSTRAFKRVFRQDGGWTRYSSSAIYLGQDPLVRVCPGETPASWLDADVRLGGLEVSSSSGNLFLRIAGESNHHSGIRLREVTEYVTVTHVPQIVDLEFS